MDRSYNHHTEPLDNTALLDGSFPTIIGPTPAGVMTQTNRLFEVEIQAN